MPVKRSTRKRERRGTARADARLSMRLKGTRPDGNLTQVVTESQNISSSGVYCLSSHYLAPLSKVDLAIVLPRLPGGRGTKDIINCEGIVVRCDTGPRRSDNAYELACMFTELDPGRRQRLEEFVTWRNLQALRAATNGPVRPARRAGAARTGLARTTPRRRETAH